jgi:hypothetical protein
MCVWVGPNGELYQFPNLIVAYAVQGPWHLDPDNWELIEACGAAASLKVLEKHSWQPLWTSEKLNNSNEVIMLACLKVP